MTLTRLIPLHVHAVVETILAPVLIVAPFAFGFSAPALIASVVLGVLLMGTALSTGAGLAGQDGGLRVSAHASFDLGLAAAAAICSFALGFTVDPVAGLFFGAVAILQSFLATSTRYSTLPA
jgi:hypothetical protein